MRDSLGSRVRRLTLLVLLAAACDPGVRTEYILPSQGGPLNAVIGRSQALAISRAIAGKYGLLVKAETAGYCDLLSATGSDEARGNTVMLRLCVRRLDSTRIAIVVLEGFTDLWGARGDSLRHELHDTLATAFGPALQVR